METLRNWLDISDPIGTLTYNTKFIIERLSLMRQRGELEDAVYEKIIDDLCSLARNAIPFPEDIP